ncbi:MAG: hypothetical protein ACKVXR_17450 [Planctomycetota bacterium]
MEDWEARLADLEGRLREWNVRYAKEMAAVSKERGLRGFLKRPRPEQLQAAAEEAQRRAGTEVLADFAALVDEICDRYETSLPQDRATIRARVGSLENVFELFWSAIEQAPERVRGPGAEKAFRRALVALVIDDLRAEIGQVDEALGRLLLAAAAAGIDWRSHVAEVAKAANKGMGGGGGGMREYLTEYESSHYFRHELGERLREAGRSSLARSGA